MRQIILHMMMSLDGFVAPPNKDESWMVVPDHDRDAASLEVANQCEVALVGHGVFPDMAGYWPTATGETETQRALIERVNQLPKLVVTREPITLPWNSTALVTTEDELAARVADLKHEAGGDVLMWGGARLAQRLSRSDLIDEYRLIQQPVTLGAGRSIFANLPSWRRYQLLEARPFRTGAVLLRYLPTR